MALTFPTVDLKSKRNTISIGFVCFPRRCQATAEPKVEFDARQQMNYETKSPGRRRQFFFLRQWEFFFPVDIDNKIITYMPN